MPDLVTEVAAELQGRKGEWRLIAANLPGISYSWLSQLGRGAYTSEPSYSRLRRVHDFLRAHKGKPIQSPAAKAA